MPSADPSMSGGGTLSNGTREGSSRIVVGGSKTWAPREQPDSAPVPSAPASAPAVPAKNLLLSIGRPLIAPLLGLLQIDDDLLTVIAPTKASIETRSGSDLHNVVEHLLPAVVATERHRRAVVVDVARDESHLRDAVLRCDDFRHHRIARCFVPWIKRDDRARRRRIVALVPDQLARCVGGMSEWAPVPLLGVRCRR